MINNLNASKHAVVQDWRAALKTLQPTLRSSMTQLFPCLVPTCPDGSGAFWTVSAQALADVQPVSISGVTSTTHCASVELPRPCHTSLTAARYTSLKVVLLPFTQHLIPRWSGCATAAYAKERSGISWAICRSAPWPIHTTMQASHHSLFYRPDALPATQPTTSKQCFLPVCVIVQQYNQQLLQLFLYTSSILKVYVCIFAGICTVYLARTRLSQSRIMVCLWKHSVQFRRFSSGVTRMMVPYLSKFLLCFQW